MSLGDVSGRLAGKVAIVSGAGQTPGENIGNGRAIALLFARAGASVLCVDREEARASETVAEIEGEELEFSGGFTDLHTQSYQNILAGNGFGIDENRVAIETVEKIREMPLAEAGSKAHPLLSKVL